MYKKLAIILRRAMAYPKWILSIGRHTHGAGVETARVKREVLKGRTEVRPGRMLLDFRRFTHG
jgi:hypothetical protein